VLLLSNQEASDWKQFYPRVRYEVVVNPFLPLEESTGEILKLPETLPTLLFVGRILAAKGILDLLEAMAQVSKVLPCRLIIVGDGSDISRARALTEKLGLSDSVSFTGYLRGPQLWAAYQKAKIFILPTTWSEGFPTAISEAMYFGLPIITTPIRGMVDHLMAGENTLFVQPHSPDELAQAILCLLTDSDLCQRMGAANRLKVKEFSPEKAARLYLNALEKILAFSSERMDTKEIA
jgi:glycosyltransferase involved in cell wall biosynthesis